MLATVSKRVVAVNLVRQDFRFVLLLLSLVCVCSILVLGESPLLVVVIQDIVNCFSEIV